MSIKIEWYSKWNVTQNGMSLKKNSQKIRMSPKIEFHLKKCHSKLNVNKNGMSLQIECHSKFNVTQSGMSLKMECHS